MDNAFKSIKGQLQAKKILLQLFKAGRIGHAYLFVGIDGIGKRMMAKTISQVLLYPDGSKQDCQKIRDNRHPDVRMIDDEGKRIGVGRIRSLRKDSLIPPYTSAYKVYIINQAHKLTNQAQNAFLKLLEEPESNIIFILIVEDLSVLLPTVISRCQVIRFTPLSEQCMIDILSEHNYTGNVATLACALCQGSAGQALKFCQTIDWAWMEDVLHRVLDAVLVGDCYALLNLAESIVKEADSLDDFLNAIAVIYQRVLRRKTGCEISLALPEELQLYQQMTLSQLFWGSQAIADSKKMLDHYQNKQLVIETLFLKLQEG